MVLLSALVVRFGQLYVCDGTGGVQDVRSLWFLPYPLLGPMRMHVLLLISFGSVAQALVLSPPFYLSFKIARASLILEAPAMYINSV